MSKLFRFDFTLGCEKFDGNYLNLKDILKEFCKKGTFQEEKAWIEEINGIPCEPHYYHHFQGRVSTTNKITLSKLIKDTNGGPINSICWSPTSANCVNVDYASKVYTRVAGPWDIEEEIEYIPKQIREITNLFDWQQSVVDALSIWDKRSINMIYCPDGNIGKSTLVGWIRAYKLGRALPPVNDYKDMLRIVCDLPVSKAYIIDMPRALKKDKLWGFYSAIETIKDGYAYDDRYHFKEKIFDCPNIWIFSNIKPDFKLLSKDRWKIYNIQNGNLVLNNNCLFEADCVL
ncbi:MAG: replication protein [Cressdnaviricota sp.]|nr:MAG: replication protein [Cressdnaviricota sp.]